MIRILLTTTSFQDCPGEHHTLLENIGAEIVRERGPLSEEQMLKIVGDFDAFLCGDDEITQKVIDKSLPRLKIISKYGIGIDKINVTYASKKSIPVSFCPGVNHTTVAEHVFMLLLALSKNLIVQANATNRGDWQRMTGFEIMGKTIGIIGLGRIGREVSTRAKAFGMDIIAYDIYWPEEFANQNNITQARDVLEVLKLSDIVSLHTNLTEDTRYMINKSSIDEMKDGAILINCGRGELTHAADIAVALNSGRLGGYATDVLEHEPPSKNHPLLGVKNCIITPHVASRTYESVERQAKMATQNLVNLLKGEDAIAQVNDVPTPAPLI